MLTLLALTALLQAPPVPLVSADPPLPSLEATAASAFEPREVTQLAQFVGKNLLSWDLATQSMGGFRLRQGARTFAITDDLTEPLHLVPAALGLAQAAQQDYQLGMTLLWVGTIGVSVGISVGMITLLLVTGTVGIVVAMVGLMVGALSMIPMLLSTRHIADGTAHFSDAMALYNRSLLDLRPTSALSQDFSAPPLLRF